MSNKPQPSRGRPAKDPRFRAISWPLSFHPPQIMWIKEQSLKWGLHNSRFLQALVDRAMVDPDFVQNAVINYCQEEYGDLPAKKTRSQVLGECIQDLLNNTSVIASEEQRLAARSRAVELLATPK